MVRKSDDFDTLYMPVWSWAEIETARPIYPNVELDWAKKLFKTLGGVVRCSSDIVFKLHAQQGFKMLLSCRHVLAKANKPETPSLIDEVVPLAANIRMLMQAGLAGGQVCMCWVHHSVCKARTLLNVQTWRAIGINAGRVRQATARHPR